MGACMVVMLRPRSSRDLPPRQSGVSERLAVGKIHGRCSSYRADIAGRRGRQGAQEKP